MKSAKKIILWLVVVVLVVVGALVALFLFGIGGTVKTAVNAYGPKLLGAPVTLQDAEFSIVSGTVRLGKLHVGNPPGYDTKSLFDADTLLLEVDTLSLFSGTIHVRKIYVDKPSITYELGKDSNNIRDLLNHLGGAPKVSTNAADHAAKGGHTGDTSVAKTPPAPASTNVAVIAAKKGPKFIVDEIIVDKPKLAGSITGAEGRQIAVTLGEIKMKDIGKAQGGVTLDEAMKAIVADLTGKVEEATAGVTASIKNTAKDLKKSAQPLLDTIKNLFGGGKKDKKKTE